MKYALLAAAIVFAPAVACAADASGAWKFKSTGPQGGTATMSCTLTQSGTAVTGSCVTQQGSTVNVSGTLNGTDLDIGYDVAGSPLHIGIKGVIQPDGTIKGTVTPTMPSTPFVGTKQ